MPGNTSRSLPQLKSLQTNIVLENSQTFICPHPLDNFNAAPLFQSMCDYASIDVGLSLPVDFRKEKCAQA